MAKIGLFYGSSTGNTEFVAYQMQEELEARHPGLVEIFNIGSVTPEQVLRYDFLIFGIPTWNTGQLQDDWAIFLPKLAGHDMTGKHVAIFGLGDQNGYGFNFLDAVGMLADAVQDRNAVLCGLWPIHGYEFEESLAQVEDHFLGLGIDQEGQSALTTGRVQAWLSHVLFEFGLEESVPTPVPVAVG